jgi:hypothetical protein
MQHAEISIDAFIDDRVRRMYGWAIIVVLCCIGSASTLRSYWPFAALAIPLLWRAGIAYLQVRVQQLGYEGLFWWEKLSYERWIAKRSRSAT